MAEEVGADRFPTTRGRSARDRHSSLSAMRRAAACRQSGGALSALSDSADRRRRGSGHRPQPYRGTRRGVELTVSLEPASSSAMARIGETIGGMPHVLLRDTEIENGPGPILKPSSPEMPGRRAARRYQLFGEIARGGMGAVLKGRDVDLGRDLAVKVLLESHRDKPDLVRRFVEEAQIGGQLQHPGIVPVYELGTFADRRPFFTMKLVKGRTLAELARAQRVARGRRLAAVAVDLRVGLPDDGLCPPRGVIHRDLKPSNVMVGSFGEVQVMDWGLAKVLPAGRGGRRRAERRPSRRSR